LNRDYNELLKIKERQQNSIKELKESEVNNEIKLRRINDE